MDIATLTQQHKLYFKPEVRAMCTHGLIRMKDSLDIAHGVDHIKDVLKSFNTFLHSNGSLKKNIDPEVMALAICWHDVWRAQRNPQTVLQEVHDAIREGMASAKLFEATAKTMRLHEQIRKKVAYAIRKHSLLQFTKRQTVEAKLLFDLDELDMFSLNRLQKVAQYYRDPQWQTTSNLRKLQVIVKYFLQRYSEDSLYFQWTKDRYLQRRDKFLNHAKALLSEFEQAHAVRNISVK